MAVILKDALFLHIPKTGGEWVRQVLWDAGLETVKLHPGKQKHADLAWFKEHPEYDRPFRFAFVRHPVAWYRSFWAYQNRRGWRRIPEVDLCPPDTPIAYPEFLEWVIENHQGFLGRLYQRYTGPFGEMGITARGPLALSFDERGHLVERHVCQVIGRVEHLRFDLAWVLSYNCEETNELPWKLLATMAPQNVSWGLPQTPMPLAERLLRSEEELCRRFDYV